jgi:putative transposase
MPRIPRGQLDGQVFHVLNRGNGRAAVFHEDADFRAFIDLLAEAKQRVPVRTAAFCVLSNHFHLVVESTPEATLSAFMHWWLTSHVRRYHRHYGTSGHVWQGRFKSFPIQKDDHFLTVVRYVLQNPVRARLAVHPNDWPWSSLHYPQLIDPWPVPRLEDDDWLDSALPAEEIQRLRASTLRQTPFGDSLWQQSLAALLGLESTLRPRGRPKRGQATFSNSQLCRINDLEAKK